MPQDAAVALMLENLSSMASRDPLPLHFDAGREYVYQVMRGQLVKNSLSCKLHILPTHTEGAHLNE